jgi:uncharacterized phage protein (TIGR01671 family)
MIPKFKAWIEKQNFMAIQGTPDLETFQSFMFHYCNEKLLMQSTGIFDKNGIEIFQNDLLIDRETDDEGNDISSVFPVIYNPKQGAWCVDNSYKKDGSSLVSIVDYFGLENLEVYGNIYQRLEIQP